MVKVNTAVCTVASCSALFAIPAGSMLKEGCSVTKRNGSVLDCSPKVKAGWPAGSESASPSLGFATKILRAGRHKRISTEVRNEEHLHSFCRVMNEYLDADIPKENLQETFFLYSFSTTAINTQKKANNLKTNRLERKA